MGLQDDKGNRVSDVQGVAESWDSSVCRRLEDLTSVCNYWEGKKIKTDFSEYKRNNFVTVRGPVLAQVVQRRCGVSILRGT